MSIYIPSRTDIRYEIHISLQKSPQLFFVFLFFFIFLDAHRIQVRVEARISSAQESANTNALFCPAGAPKRLSSLFY